jgi:transcriptional regulator with XRE-family HTH domain
LLGWSQQQLAEASGTARRTVTTVEIGGATSDASLAAIVRALEAAGVDFTGDAGNPGVALRPEV